MGKRFNGATSGCQQAQAALNVTVAYQDSLTRQWAWDLWKRVGRLTGDGDICHQSWSMANLGEADIFADAVRAAAKADVLLIAVRDTAGVPQILQRWIQAWLPRRASRPGALVALIGVPAQPNAQKGRAHRLLEGAARKAGLDFLPRERKLPDQPRPAPSRRRVSSRKPATALVV